MHTIRHKLEYCSFIYSFKFYSTTQCVFSFEFQKPTAAIIHEFNPDVHGYKV